MKGGGYRRPRTWTWTSSVVSEGVAGGGHSYEWRLAVCRI